jgi:hypothetical protein
LCPYHHWTRASWTDLFPELHIPDSTRRTWLRRGVANVVSFDRANPDIIALQAHNAKLRKRVTTLLALVRLPITLVRVRGQSLLNRSIGQAVLCSSFEEFQTKFGGFTPDSELALAAMGFFENGGAQL